VANAIGMAGDPSLTRPINNGHSAQTARMARYCRYRRSSDLSLLVWDPSIQVDCAGVSAAAYWSEYRRSSFPALASMDIVRSFYGILRVVSGNCNERVSYDVSVGQCTSPELAMSASGRGWIKTRNFESGGIH